MVKKCHLVPAYSGPSEKSAVNPPESMPNARHNGYVAEEEMGWAHEANEIDSPETPKKESATLE